MPPQKNNPRTKASTNKKDRPIALDFLSVESVTKFDCGLIAKIECEPKGQTRTLIYRVLIDQTQVPGSSSDDSHIFSLITLGVQPTVPTNLSGVLDIRGVYGEEVKLGRRNKNGTKLTWKKAKKGSTDPERSQIESYYSATDSQGELDGIFIKSKSSIFGLRIRVRNPKWKGKTKWNRAPADDADVPADLKLVPGEGEGGVNVPPPIPPGSSAGDGDK